MRYATQKTINKIVNVIREQLKAEFAGLNCSIRKRYKRLYENVDLSMAYEICVFGEAECTYQRDDGDVGFTCYVSEHFYISASHLKTLSLDDIKSKMDLAEMARKNEVAPIEHKKAQQEREKAYRAHETEKLKKLKADREKAGFVPKVHVIHRPSNVKSNTMELTRVFVQGASGHGEVTGFFVGHVPKGEFAVRETGGGKVEGPFAYAYADSLCISADGRGTAWQVAQARAKGLVVEACVGDLVEIDGTQYSIEWDDTFGIRKSYIKLIFNS